MGVFLAMVYLAATLIRPQELYVELAPHNVMDILAILALLGVGLDMSLGSRPSLRAPQIALLGAFIGWAALTMVATLWWFGGAWLTVQTLSINIFVFLVLVLNGTSRRRLAWLRAAILGSMEVVVVLGLHAYYTGTREDQFVLIHRSTEDTLAETDFSEGPSGGLQRWAIGGGRSRRLRALGFLNDPNDLAQILIALLPVTWLGWRRSRPFLGTVTVLLPMGLFLWAIVLTHSRGGFIALAALAAFALNARFGGRLSRPLDLATWAGLLVLLVAFFRLGLADESAFGRREMWSEGLSMLKGSPVWGAGFDSYGDRERVAHNSYVHCFAELGLVGYWLWLAAIVATLKQLDALRAVPDAQQNELPRWASALRLSLLSFLVSALFLSRTYSVTLFLLLGLPAALAGVARMKGHRPPSWGVFPFVAEVSTLTVATVALSYVIVRLMW